MRNAFAIAMLVGLAGCSHHAGKAGPTGPPPVTVSYPLRREVTDYADFTGRTAAVDSLQVRARVTGYLKKINFKEGAEVKQGEVLYQIDPRPYQAALDQAQAQVRLQEAQLKYQEAVYVREQRLYSNHAVALEEFQQSRAQRDTARAQVVAAKANAEQAQLNLGWTEVRSPIDGRIGRTLLTRGNLVVADQTVLSAVVSEDPMYVYFDVDEQTALRVRALIRAGKLRSVREKGIKIPVHLGLSDEEGYPHKGTVNFVSNELNPATATLQLRGVFANPAPPVGPRLLTPGLFVRVRVAVSPPHPALLVIASAVGTDQDLNYLYVVGPQNQAERRDVTLGTEHEGLREIVKGLAPDDRVIVDGIQHAHPGGVVAPKLAPMPVPRPGALGQTPPAVMPTPKRAKH